MNRLRKFSTMAALAAFALGAITAGHGEAAETITLPGGAASLANGTQDPNVLVNGVAPARIVGSVGTAGTPAIPGTKWINESFGSCGTGPNGAWNFESRFELPPAFTAPKIDVLAHADNWAIFYLNGNFFGSMRQADSQPFEQFQGPPEFFTTSNAAFFQPGENILTVRLVNVSGPKCLNYKGTVTYTPVTISAPDAVATGASPLDEGDPGSLTGSASSDPDSDPLTYSWVQLSPASPVIALSDAAAADPTFTAPVVAANTTFTFELTVDDGEFEDTDTVDVAVVNSNNPPVADAGADFSIKPGATAMLDGGASFDPETDSFTYLWAQVNGLTTVALDDDTAQSPQFTVPNDVGDVLTFVLEVDDGFEASTRSAGDDSVEADTVAVTIVENAAPVAEAGSDLIKNEGDSVTLDGTGSSDPDGDTISYAWQQIGGIPVLNLAGAGTVAPSFDLPAVSADDDVVFELTVTDDDPINPKSGTDTVTIRNTDSNSPPSCDLAFADTDALWPPNHKMKSIDIGGVMDGDDVFNSVTLTITGVTQDEPVVGTGSGDTGPDAIVQAGDPADSVLIRSERAGNGDGRVYSVQFTASDGFESCDGSVLVTVAHNRKSTAVDSGEDYDSTN